MSYIGLSAVLDVIYSLCLFFDVRVLGAAQDFLERCSAKRCSTKSRGWQPICCTIHYDLLDNCSYSISVLSIISIILILCF